MSRMTRFISMFPLALVLTACFDSSSDSAGDAKTVYVAIGNSLTAGFQSGGLRADWQKASYPVLLAEQMGITDFQIPVIDSPGIGSAKGPNGETKSPLFLDPGTHSPKDSILAGDPKALLSNRALGRPYNNLAVPGATTLDISTAYNDSSSQSKTNGYFNIVMRGAVLNNTTMLRQAISLNPDILTMWVGSNDILGGITAGTIIVGTTVTPTAIYKVLMERLFDSLLTQTHARIFVANIPAITSIPFVTTIPRFVFSPTTFAVDTTQPLLTEETDVKYVLLPALGEILKGTGFPVAAGGNGTKLAANLTLTVTEAEAAAKLVEEYNAYLKEKTDSKPDRLTLVDVNGLLNKLTAGGVPDLSGKFYLFDAAHTAFSYDGVHPNSKGYRQVANLYLDAINSTLNKSFPKLTP
jgi:lysophospholipase L1-like esterase